MARGRVTVALALLMLVADVRGVIRQVPPSALNCTPSGFMSAQAGRGAVGNFSFGNFGKAGEHRGGVLVFLQLGKVGSSTMRTHLRSVLKGARNLPNAGHAHDLRISRGPSRLGRVPVARGFFGLCSTVWETSPNLPCAYFTLLRHPVARIISAYAYFCRACSERGRRCKQDSFKHSPFLPRVCPDLTITEFARLHGQYYVELLSGLSACASCDLSALREQPQPLVPLSYYEVCDPPERIGVGATPYVEAIGEMVAQAKANLRHGVLPLILEEGVEKGLALAAKMFRAKQLAPRGSLRVVNSGANAAKAAGISRSAPNAADIAWLTTYLAADIELYDFARGLYREYRSRYSPRAKSSRETPA
jgi:hypothetical protein